MAKGFGKGFGGMNMGNMGSIMAQAQKMQKDLENAQQEIKMMRIEGSAGGGLVKVTLGGDHRLYDLQIAKEVIDPEKPSISADTVFILALLINCPPGAHRTIQNGKCVLRYTTCRQSFGIRPHNGLPVNSACARPPRFSR